jgi:putative oxidoreductase
MRLGRTVLRALVGGLFAAHGAQKLFGWFDGPGLEGTKGMMGALGYEPQDRAALLVGASETGGGALLALGFLTPLGASAVMGSMFQAIEKVHGPKGPWNTDGGWEFNAVLAAVALAIAAEGPGDLSLDEALGLRLHGPVWAALALAGGVLGPRVLLNQATPEVQPA